jgi:hypothetical protein
MRKTANMLFQCIFCSTEKAVALALLVGMSIYLLSFSNNQNYGKHKNITDIANLHTHIKKFGLKLNLNVAKLFPQAVPGVLPKTEIELFHNSSRAIP